MASQTVFREKSLWKPAQEYQKTIFGTLAFPAHYIIVFSDRLIGASSFYRFC